MTEHRFEGQDHVATAAFHADRAAADHVNQPGFHRNRLLYVAELVRNLTPSSWIDYGCGNGGLLSLVPEVTASAGYDFQPSNVKAAQALGRPVERLDFTNTALLTYADLVTMTEVLEHMDDPHGFLARVPCTWLIASCPLGETPGHHDGCHLWGWDREGFVAMFEGAGFSSVEWAEAYGCQFVVAER